MPRFGELRATDVWAASSRTLSAFAAADLFDLPSADAFTPSGQVFATSGVGANTFGAWVQVVADVGAGKRLVAVGVRVTTAGVFEMEIGEGAAGAEVAVARLASGGAALDVVTLNFWRSVSDNARLALRVRDSEAAALEYYSAPQIV